MVTLVEMVDSESQSQQENRFQELVKELIVAIKQDGCLKDNTPQMYNQKKLNLINHLIELFGLHKVLISNLKVRSSDSGSRSLQLVKYRAPEHRTPIGYDGQLTRKKLSDLEEEIVSLNQNLQNSAKEISLLKDKIEEKESELEGEKSMVNKLNKQTDELEAEIADKNVTAENLKKEIVSLNKNLQNSTDEISKLKDKIGSKVSEMQSKQTYINTQKTLLEAEKSKVNKLNKQTAELKAEIADKNVTAENLREEIVSLNKNLQNSTDEISKLKNKIEAKVAEMQSKQKYINTQKTLLEAEKSKVNNLNKQMAKLKAEISDKNVTAENLREEVEKCKEKNKEVDKYSKNLLVEKLAYEQEISKLEEIEKIRNDVIEKLKRDLDENSELLDCCLKKFDAVNAHLETLLAKKSSPDNKIQELEDSHICLKIYVAENAEGFHERVEEILEEINSTLRYNTTVRLDFVLRGGSSSFCVSKTEDSKSPLSESHISTNGPETLLKKNFSLEEELKQQLSIKDSTEKQMFELLQSVKPLLDHGTNVHSREKKMGEFQEKLLAQIAKRDDQITNLRNKTKQYTSEISKLKSAYKFKENNRRTTIGKLRKALEKKGESVEDLNKKLDTLRAEKCSQENLIQKLETRFDSLQSDYVGVVSSFDNAQNDTNQLTERVSELEREVDMQREVISVRDEEKREAIRQLTSAVEHYKFRYEELRKEFVSRNTASCFDFLR